jgi:hypothetical protein
VFARSNEAAPTLPLAPMLAPGAARGECLPSCPSTHPYSVDPAIKNTLVQRGRPLGRYFGKPGLCVAACQQLGDPALTHVIPAGFYCTTRQGLKNSVGQKDEVVAWELPVAVLVGVCIVVVAWLAIGAVRSPKDIYVVSDPDASGYEHPTTPVRSMGGHNGGGGAESFDEPSTPVRGATSIAATHTITPRSVFATPVRSNHPDHVVQAGGRAIGSAEDQLSGEETSL